MTTTIEYLNKASKHANEIITKTEEQSISLIESVSDQTRRALKDFDLDNLAEFIPDPSGIVEACSDFAKKVVQIQTDYGKLIVETIEQSISGNGSGSKSTTPKSTTPKSTTQKSTGSSGAKSSTAKKSTGSSAAKTSTTKTTTGTKSTSK